MREEMITRKEPEVMLFEDETKVVSLAIRSVLQRLTAKPSAGNFVLFGQQKGREAGEIMYMKLGEGLADLHEMQREAMTDAIKRILKWPANLMDAVEKYLGNPLVSLEEFAFQGIRPQPEFFGELPTGIYDVDGLLVMVLNTTLGRFVMSAALVMKTEEHPLIKLNNNSLLFAAAQALATMNADVVLERSLKKLLKEADEPEKTAAAQVNALFRTKNAEITVWGLRADDRPERLYFDFGEN